MDRYASWVATLTANVRREYPHKPGYVIHGEEDLRAPHVVHPAFYGSFDWHSSVHSHWSLVRLLRLRPDLPGGAEARRVLAEHLREVNLEAERAHLAAQPLFERPYGWAWALALASELDRWEEASDIVAVGAARRLATDLCGMLAAYVRALPVPVRAGTHGDTAFAMVLGHHHATLSSHHELRTVIEERTRDWYVACPAAPHQLEPSGEDFLSPTLTTAHLVARILDRDAFASWLDGYLPQLSPDAPTPLTAVPTVPDASDGRIVHLHGLALSRAWSWRAIADALRPDDPRRDRLHAAAEELVGRALPHVVSGEYAGDHWLVSFALLAEHGL